MVTTPGATRPQTLPARSGGLRGWLHRVGTAILGKRTPPPAPPPTTDRGTLLAERRTKLAFKRTYLAEERTLMAWIRTSLSMISFGFTIVKFFEYLEAERKLSLGWFGRSWGPATLGLTLITIGTLALAVAVIQHRKAMNVLREQGLVPQWSLVLTVATLVAVLGVYAFGTLVLKY
jgi:putative membrane protein